MLEYKLNDFKIQVEVESSNANQNGGTKGCIDVRGKVWRYRIITNALDIRGK